MTRRDYERLAKVIRQATDLDHATELLADVLEADNPRFDRIRFYAACGYPQVTA